MRRFVLERERFVLERERFVLERERFVLERERFVLERERDLYLRERYTQCADLYLRERERRERKGSSAGVRLRVGVLIHMSVLNLGVNAERSKQIIQDLPSG